MKSITFIPWSTSDLINMRLPGANLRDAKLSGADLTVTPRPWGTAQCHIFGDNIDEIA